MAQALQDYAAEHSLKIQEVSYIPSLEDQAANRQAYLDQGVDPDTDMNVVMEGGVNTEVAYALTEDGALAFVRGFYGGTIYHLYADPKLGPAGLEFPSLYRPAEQSSEQIAQLQTWFVEADPAVLGQMANPQYVYAKQYNYIGDESLRTSLYFDNSDNPNQAAVNLTLKSVAPLSLSMEGWIDEIWPGYSDKYLAWTDEGKPQANYFLGTSTAWQGAFEKIGDYPIISPEEAKERFLAGQASREFYQDFISAEEAAQLNVVATELVYPDTLPSPAAKIVQPFYRLVIQGEQLKNVDTQEPLFTEEGDPIYGYHFVMVPAVADEWVDWDYEPQSGQYPENIANTETFLEA